MTLIYWRIIHTIGHRLTKVKPRSGFCAEKRSGRLHPVLYVPQVAGVDHTYHSGRGCRSRFRSAGQGRRWGVAQNIVWAWILTIPASALLFLVCATPISAMDMTKFDWPLRPHEA